MSWTEIVIDVARDQAEALSDALLEAGALSVSVEDADSGSASEQPLFGEPGIDIEHAAWTRSRVIALTPQDSDQAALLDNALQLADLPDTQPQYTLRPVAEQDWVRLTQSQFEPIHIGKRIWIVPSWHQPPEPDAIVLRLDPGLAFGTGSHPTTRLCIEWLEQQQLAGSTLLDYGCGSGILALVAKKLGSAQTVGVDLDPQAISAALRNASENQVALEWLDADQFAANATSQKFDIVVANILANPLMQLAPALIAHVRPGGQLLLSGVLERQVDAVAAAYAPWIRLTVWSASEGWVALCGQPF